MQLSVIECRFINTLCTAAMLLPAATLNAQNQYTFTALGVPGGYDTFATYATGVSGTNIVGYYYDTNGKTHGFLYNCNSYATLDVPGAEDTYANGICGTNIVGYYYDTNGDTDGFLYNGSSYTTLDVPGAQNTEATDISSTNVVGDYSDGDGNYYGFLYSGGTCVTLAVPGAQDTYANGVSGTNIVGYYYDAIGNTHGFLYNGSGYTTLDVPGAQATYANGICGTNIVGYYYDTSGDTDGFLYNGSSYATLDVPGPEDTEANGISGISIVGYYVWNYRSGYGEYSFLATLDSPLCPPLQIEPGAGQVILQWPACYTGFSLQTATNYASSATWTCYPATPVVNGANFNVTVIPDEAQRYFRLCQPANGEGSVSSLDEWTFNQTFNDSGPGENELTATGSTNYVAGLDGFDAMSFNGTSQYVTSDTNLGITGMDFTISGWVSSTNDGPDQCIFVWNDSGAGLFFIIGNGSALIGGSGKTGWVSYGAAPASSGAQTAWFFALVSTATGYTCYTNGAIAGIGPPLFDTVTNPIPSAPIRIGYTTSQGYGLGGTVQDFQVYNTNLTAGQVYSLYSAGAQ